MSPPHVQQEFCPAILSRHCPMLAFCGLLHSSELLPQVNLRQDIFRIPTKALRFLPRYRVRRVKALKLRQSQAARAGFSPAMKQRFSSIDVKVCGIPVALLQSGVTAADNYQVIAHELQQNLVSLRLANIYDLSSKILLLKFAKPDNKQQLLIDTGFRCHLTNFTRTTAAAPSAFVARLRKFLKTRRLTSVSQVGTDRILEFQFSDGLYRVFLEFFAVSTHPFETYKAFREVY